MLVERIDRGALAELAARGKVLTGELSSRELTRLAPMLADDGNARLSCSLALLSTERGVASLQLQIDGELPLICQRCLGTLQWPVSLQARLAVVESEADAESLDDPFESALMEDGALLVHRLIEDELLAAAPLAPRHAGAAACTGPGYSAGPDKAADQDTIRPFAGLSELMKSARQGSAD